MKEIIELIENYLSDENIKQAAMFVNKIKSTPYFYYYTGEIKRIKGMITDSKKYYEKVIYDRNADDDLKFNSILKLISVFRSEGKIKETHDLIEKAKKIKPEDHSLNLEIAMYYRMKGDFNMAERKLKKILYSYIKSKDNQAIAYIKWALGGIYRLTGEFKKSISMFISAVKYAQKSNDISLKIYSMLGLAGVLRVYGDIDGSYKMYSSVYRILNSDDHFAKAYVYCGMANALRQKGDLKKAIINYKKSYNLYRKIGDRLDLGLVLWGIGECYKKTGKLNIALNFFKKAEKLFESGFEPRGLILNKISTAQTLYLIGKKDEAKNTYFKALDMAEKNNLTTYLEIFT